MRHPLNLQTIKVEVVESDNVSVTFRTTNKSRFVADQTLNNIRFLFHFVCVCDLLCCGFELARISLRDHVPGSAFVEQTDTEGMDY